MCRDPDRKHKSERTVARVAAALIVALGVTALLFGVRHSPVGSWPGIAAHFDANPAAEASLGLTLASPPAGGRSGEVRDAVGAFVVGVAPGSPAAASGLTPGDLISRIDDRVIARPDDVKEALRSALRGGKQAVSVLATRAGRDYYFVVQFDHP